MKLNRNQLKYFAIICMTLDHVAWLFVDGVSPTIGGIMHLFGRLTAPIMAFFLVEGYEHTRDVNKYTARLAIFAVISWIPYVLMQHGTLPIWFSDGELIFHPEQSMIYTLFLALIALRVYDGEPKKWAKVLIITALCVISCIGDWLVFPIGACLLLHAFKDNKKKRFIAFEIWCCLVALSSVFMQWFQIGVVFAPIIIYFLYNGESGSKKPFHKWFFYIYYPAHLLILGIIKILVMKG